MVHIPRVAAHGLLLEDKTEIPACLMWKHTEGDDPYVSKMRANLSPDANDMCSCSPGNAGVPRKFYMEDGPHTDSVQLFVGDIFHDREFYGGERFFEIYDLEIQSEIRHRGY